METTLAVSLDCDLRRERSRWLRGLHAGVTPHAEKSPAMFDEATEDLVLGIEDAPAEASSRFTKQQDQREAMPGGPPSRHSWRPVRCRRCSPWRLLRLGHVHTARAVAEHQRHRQPRLAVYFSQSTGPDGPCVRPSVTSQVLTNRVGGSISTYVPRHEHSLPSGVTKTVWRFPPTGGRSHGSSPCLPRRAPLTQVFGLGQDVEDESAQSVEDLRGDDLELARAGAHRYSRAVMSRCRSLWGSS